MFTRLNILLLAGVLASGYYVVDLNNSIKHQTQLYGKGQEAEIRLNQDYAELQYEHSQAVDLKLVHNAAGKLRMHAPAPQETVILQFR
ncbi:cell division protein FtsL [Conchiformibius steedae]|uniref:cell division protein FtsL n=1 Tax=Conchiformibius steedae TaxID=153493 RepID=UPI0026F0F351|nr:cell division protein FtsL [Conchiformibius steedae]